MHYYNNSKETSFQMTKESRKPESATFMGK